MGQVLTAGDLRVGGFWQERRERDSAWDAADNLAIGSKNPIRPQRPKAKTCTLDPKNRIA